MDFALVLANASRDRLFLMETQTLINAGTNLLNVAILATVLAFLLYRPVRNILRKRMDKIQGQLSQAEEEMSKATELKLLYEKKLEDIESERDEILVEARKQAAEKGRMIVTEAKKEAESVKERATANVKLEWERAETEMRAAIIDVSAVMAEKLVALSVSKETHERLFDETMTDLGGMTWRD